MKRGIWTIPFALAVLLFVSAEPTANRLAAAPQSAQPQEKVQSTQAKPPGMQQPPTQGAQAKPPAPPQPTQAAGPKPDQPAAQPPGLVALNDALRIADNAKRFDALQKVIGDYPKSEAASVARAQLASQLAASLKADKTALQNYVTKQLPDSKNPADYNQFASNLLGVELFLEEAEATAKKGLAIDEQTYMAAMKEARNAAGPPLMRTLRNGVVAYVEGIVIGGRGGRSQREVADNDLRGQFKTAHVNLLATLGQIYAKRGKTAEAEKTLKEVYAADLPSAAKRTVATALADLAAKAGAPQDEIEYRATAYVLGGASATARETLETVYRKAHNGSLDGLDAVLDEKYRKSIKPLEVKAYTRPKTRNPRLVLAELFTGAACPPCIGADMAFDAALERFSRQDMALIVYHQHIPGPDPMTNPATEARKDIYALRGVPTFAIDGKSVVGGGGAAAAEGIFNRDVGPLVEKRLAVAPEARIQLNATMVGSTIRVKANVSHVKSKSSKLKLQIALVEELQRYSGPNGVRFHPMVVRDLAGPDFKGFPLTAKGAKVEHVFDLAKILADNKKAIDQFLTRPFRGGDKPTFIDGRRDEIDASRLLVVAFAQDEDPAQDKPSKPAAGAPAGRGNAPAAGGPQSSPVRQVLQAVSVKVGAAKKTTN
jgi:tetratricopeptide (TPR) repeat protein